MQRVALMLLAIATALPAPAEDAIVEAVQYPAWIERDAHSAPLTPGTVLQARDTLRTGSDARVQLRLAEGSTVKLGENARFVIERVESRGIFRAALSVIAGAFRFTTDALARPRARDISVRVRNVTAGIRGTDVWGKSTDERDLVCLLEGRIAVGSEGHPTVTLDQPRDFYQKPRDGEPQVARVDEKQVAQWAQETEIAEEGPAARAGGQWRVVAAIAPDRDQALERSRTLHVRGYPAEIVAKEGYFVVQVAGLAGEREALALQRKLRAIPGIPAPSVSSIPP